MACTVDEMHFLKKMATAEGDFIRAQALYSYLKSRKNNSFSFQGQATTLPQFMMQLEMNQFMTLIRNLDPNCTGFINYRQLLSYLILARSPIPTEAQAEVVQALADASGYVS